MRALFLFLVGLSLLSTTAVPDDFKQEFLDESLKQAVLSGKLGAAEQFLKQGAKTSGHILIQALIYRLAERKWDSNRPHDSRVEEALIEKLLKAGAKMPRQESVVDFLDGMPWGVYADDALKILKKNKVDLGAQDEHGLTFAGRLFKRKQFGVEESSLLEDLARLGVRFSERDRRLFPFHRKDIIKEFQDFDLKRFESLNPGMLTQKDTKGNTPLMAAIQRGDGSAIEALADFKISPKDKFSDGTPALIRATQDSSYGTYRWSSQNLFGTDSPNDRDKLGNSLVHHVLLRAASTKASVGARDFMASNEITYSDKFSKGKMEYGNLRGFLAPLYTLVDSKHTKLRQLNRKNETPLLALLRSEYTQKPQPIPAQYIYPSDSRKRWVEPPMAIKAMELLNRSPRAFSVDGREQFAASKEELKEIEKLLPLYQKLLDSKDREWAKKAIEILKRTQSNILAGMGKYLVERFEIAIDKDLSEKAKREYYEQIGLTYWKKQKKTNETDENSPQREDIDNSKKRTHSR